MKDDEFEWLADKPNSLRYHLAHPKPERNG